jgi:hypothetical protein
MSFVIASFLHLAPHAPWVWLALASFGLLAIGLWAYRFAVPPLPALARRALPSLRILSLLALLWLLAQPVIERARGHEATRVAVLVDRSWSMDLPAGEGDRQSRAQEADQAARDLTGALRGRALVRELPFAARLGGDSTFHEGRGATALGSVLAELARSPQGQNLDGVVVVSDGIVNAGEDPVTAARALGVPVSAVLVGSPETKDRAVLEVEAPSTARVGERTPVRVRLSGTGTSTPLMVRLFDRDREIAHAQLPAPVSGAEATAELLATPTRPGLALWTATVDSVPGEITTSNNSRQVALEVTPGRLGVLLVSASLDWDLAFVRRALSGDSSLALDTRVRQGAGWQGLEHSKAGAPSAADLRGRAVVVLDGIAPAELGAEFDRAVLSFVRSGGGLLLFGGSAPGLKRFSAGASGAELGVQGGGNPRGASPVPTPEAREVLSWDDDPARGDRAWRAAAPLNEAFAIRPGAGDRLLLAAADGGGPLMMARRIGRGQSLFVNGTGLWRWSLAGLDEFSGDRGRRLWRRVIRWLAEPVQGEPLRVKPEQWLAARGEPVRLLASLQDREFRPLAGAQVEGEVEDVAGRHRRITFAPREAGSYEATVADLPPGRYRVRARATRSGQELGSSTSEFAVDRWSLEEARTDPDSATLAAVAAAGGGRLVSASDRGRAIRALPIRALAHAHTESLRLWESPWLFAVVVGALSLEWAWRRRRGLP